VRNPFVTEIRTGTVRVCLFAKGTVGLSEPMSNLEASRWAREAVALYPELRYCIIPNYEPSVKSQLESADRCNLSHVPMA
jgi:hypothetical protein